MVGSGSGKKIRIWADPDLQHCILVVPFGVLSDETHSVFGMTVLISILGLRRNGQKLCRDQPEGRGSLLPGRLCQGGDPRPEAGQEEEHGAVGARLWRQCHEQR